MTDPILDLIVPLSFVVLIVLVGAIFLGWCMATQRSLSLSEFILLGPAVGAAVTAFLIGAAGFGALFRYLGVKP